MGQRIPLGGDAVKSFDRLIALFLLLAAAAFAAVNLAFRFTASASGRQHMVDVNRVVRYIEENGTVPDAADYPAVTGIYTAADGDIYSSDSEYVIREVGGTLYRIEYRESADNSRLILTVNAALAAFVLTAAGILLYVRRNIIKPFNGISSLPQELAKGTLTAPLKENKSRFFGRFIWGLDMLRESLEKSRRTELELQREKKTMIMSLSHDIKTPLSAIKLYAKALSKGIYRDTDKQVEVAESINAKADEIESLVGEIMRSGSDDIMDFEVSVRECYLSEVIGRICAYYRDSLPPDVFTADSFIDCMISADPDRLVEVLQNIVGNAVKYGDGRMICLSFSDEEDCRLITVANSGCTLPDSELAHIFDSFWRGSNSGSKAGNGLGLYICRRLMNLMGGEVYAATADGEMRVTVVCPKC